VPYPQKLTRQGKHITLQCVRIGNPNSWLDCMETSLRSKVTAKSQTTLPSGVRKALHLRAGDQLEYVIKGDHAVIRRVADLADDTDPVLGRFLDFLQHELEQHPERLRAFPADLRKRMRRLTTGVRVDLDEPISGPVTL
jgi:antitoxin PrlF